MTTFPAAGHISDSNRTQAEVKTDLDNWLAATKQLPGGDTETQLTIAAGNITPTLGCHKVETEGAAAADDLANIIQTNCPDGRLLLLHMANAAHVVTVKHAAGGAGQVNLAGGADKVLRGTTDWLLLKRTGTLWEEVMTSGSGLPTGGICPYAGASAPPGFLLCDGAEVSRATYAALFAAIGTIYGVGNGSTTFNVPDFKGRTILGAGAGAGLTLRTRGDKGGQEAIPDHAHIFNGAYTGADNAYTGEDQGHGYPFPLGSAYGHQHYIYAAWSSGANITLSSLAPFGVANYLIKT